MPARHKLISWHDTANCLFFLFEMAEKKKLGRLRGRAQGWLTQLLPLAVVGSIA
jgi:uncharacterized protein YbgA (DUF1722 family)